MLEPKLDHVVNSLVDSCLPLDHGMYRIALLAGAIIKEVNRCDARSDLFVRLGYAKNKLELLEKVFAENERLFYSK